MGPRGRAGFRGGLRGRGRGRGGARGAITGGRGGRGGPPRAHRGPAFDSARVEYSASEEDGSEEEGSREAEEFEGFDDASEEEEDDDKPATRPYMALIQSLTKDTDGPQAKRRKLDHQNESTSKGDVSRDEPDSTEQDVAKDIDLVEEAEEAADEQDAQDAFDEGEDDDNEEVDTSDPFESHFGAHDETSITRRLKAIRDAKWTNKKVAAKGTRIVLSGPDTGTKNDEISVPPQISDHSNLSLKHRLKESLESNKTKFDDVEQSLAPYLFGYRDLLYCHRTVQNDNSVRRLSCLHALNHVFKYISLSGAETTKLLADMTTGPGTA